MLKNPAGNLFLIIPISIILILLIFLFFAYEVNFVGGKININSKMQDVLKSNLIGQDSPELNLSQFSNKILPSHLDLEEKNYKLVNFWASWCAPCRAEHKNLIAITKLGYKIIGVNYKDGLVKAENFLQELGDPYYKIGSDKNGEAAIAWGVYGIPETFLISPENKIIEKIAGPVTRSIYESKLKKHLDP